MSHSRKSLSVIQASAVDHNTPKGEKLKEFVMVRGNENACKSSSRLNTSVSIYRDPPSCQAKHDAETQTDVAEGCCICMSGSSNVAGSVQNAGLDYLLVTQEETPSEYWPMLAERLQEKYMKLLEENEKLRSDVTQLEEENGQLRDEMSSLRLEIDQLQQDNVQLLELAKDAEYFADTLKNLTQGEELTDTKDCTAEERIKSDGKVSTTA